MSRIANLQDCPLEEWLALNNQFAEETSLLTEERARRMLGNAFAASCIRGDDGRLDALLLAFSHEAQHDSRHFAWYRQHFARFIYLDRIVTAEHAQRRGRARALYEDLYVRTRTAGQDLVGLEVNLVPPNPTSHAFHERLGFQEVARAWSEDGRKQVRYMTRKV